MPPVPPHFNETWDRKIAGLKCKLVDVVATRPADQILVRRLVAPAAHRQSPAKARPNSVVWQVSSPDDWINSDLNY